MTEPRSDPYRALEALRAAVRDALERKRKLGQYAVVWRDGKVTRIDYGKQQGADPTEHTES